MDIEFYNKLNQALHGDAGKIDRVMRFRYLNEFVKPGQILFAGSSLMEQFPIQEFVADFDLPLTIYNKLSKVQSWYAIRNLSRISTFR